MHPVDSNLEGEGEGEGKSLEKRIIERESIQDCLHVSRCSLTLNNHSQYASSNTKGKMKRII